MIYPNTGTVLLLFSSFDLFLSQQEKHQLHHRFSALTKTDKFPEFRAEAVFDDKQIENYSNDWINAPAEPPDSRDWFLHQLTTLSNCSNPQCSELHVLQRITGCELEKLPDGTENLRAFDEYGFDGEDFIVFNSDALQWIDKNPKAKETKMKWDQQTERNQFLQHYLQTCMHWISTSNNTRKNLPCHRWSACFQLSAWCADLLLPSPIVYGCFLRWISWFRPLSEYCFQLLFTAALTIRTLLCQLVNQMFMSLRGKLLMITVRWFSSVWPLVSTPEILR